MQKMRRKSTTSIESFDSTVRVSRKSRKSQASADLSVVSENVVKESENLGILPHPRTDKLLREYLEFKAARIIQKYARCWHARLMYKRQRSAAMIIQRAWRGFYYAHRWYYRYVENLLQERIERHFYDSATKIAAWWRGWLVRLHVHDHYTLMREQLRLAEELLQCVAYKLHHLIRTKQIPGIYSVRNSQALSKIEKLIAAFSFHHFHSSEMVKLQNMKLKPFDAEKIGQSEKCKTFFKQKEMDTHMYDILRLYDTTMKEDEQVVAYYEPVAAKLKVKPKKPVATFCSDIIKVLNRWKILTDSDKKFDVENIKDPIKLDKFLTEIRSIYDRMQFTSCTCCKPQI